MHEEEAHPVVPARDEREQRPRPGKRRVREGYAARDRSFFEAFGRTEPAKEGAAISIGNVDAHLLHQSSGQEAAEIPSPKTRTREGRAARALRKEEGQGMIAR